MSLNGSLVGVTSHTTPLPAGEGLGEGPAPHGLETVRKKALLTLWALWEKILPSMRERGDKNRWANLSWGDMCYFQCAWKTFTKSDEIDFIYDRNISKMEEYNTHEFRELWTRNEERPFLHQERPLLVSRRACSRTLKGIFHNLEWPPLYLRTMKIAYKYTLLNPPKHPCLVHNPTS